MKIAFAGTPEFAATAMRRAHGAGHEIALAFTKPDQPGRRGSALLPSPVKTAALELGIVVHQPRSLRLDGKYHDDARAAKAALEACGARVLVVAAYGLILPKWSLEALPDGALNIHASLLPRWRGAAPIERAIEAGDSETGVCLMGMDEGLDTGPVALRASTPIGPYDDSGALFDRLADLGADMLMEGLNLLERKALAFEPQPASGASYAKKIEPSEAFVDWSLPAETLARIGRALSPHMAMRAYLGADPFSLWRAEACDASISGAQPGQILRVGRDAMDIACGQGGALRVYEIQKPGGKRLAPWAVKQGYPLAEGRAFAKSSA